MSFLTERQIWVKYKGWNHSKVMLTKIDINVNCIKEWKNYEYNENPINLVTTMFYKNWIKICIFPWYFINTPLFYGFLSSVFKKSSNHLLNKTQTLSDPPPLWLQVIYVLCLLLSSDSRPRLGLLSPRHLTVLLVESVLPKVPWLSRYLSTDV